MAITTLSELGGVLQDSRGGEIFVTCIADGTAKAGDLATVLATGAVRQTDLSDNYDETLGILMPHFQVDMDTAITANKVCDIVIPIAGHLYGCKCGNLATDVGEPLTIGEAGAFAAGGNVEAAHQARSYFHGQGDSYAIIIWVG